MLTRMIRYLFCLFFLSSGLVALAQNARFTGQVTDPQNAAISGAEVQIVNKDTLVTAVLTVGTSLVTPFCSGE